MSVAKQRQYILPSLTERIMSRLRLSYTVSTILVLLVFGGALLLAMWSDGLFAPSKGKNSKTTMEGVYLLQTPFMIAYVFFLFSYLRGWLDKVVISFRPLLSLNEHAFLSLLEGVQTRNRRTQLIVTSIYTSLSVVLLGLGGWSDKFPALSLYWLVGLTVLSVLIGQLIATIPMLGRQLCKAMLEHATEYNIFNPGPLFRVAHWSLRVTLAFMGAIIFGELLVPAQNLLDPVHLIGNGFFILFTLGLHLLMIYSTHDFMHTARGKELVRVRTQLKLCYNDLHVLLENNAPVPPELELSIRSLLALEERLLRVPTWPQNNAILRRLVVTILLPTIIMFGKKAVFKFLLAK